MTTVGIRYRVGVDIKADLFPILPKEGRDGAAGRLLRELMANRETLDRWIDSLVRWELGSGEMEKFTEDLHADGVLSAAFPLLDRESRQYFERFSEKGLFYDVSDVLLGTCHCQARSGTLECVLSREPETVGLPYQRQYRARIEVDAEMRDLDLEWAKYPYARIRETYPLDCTMSFDEYIERQRQLLNVVLGHDEIRESWMRYSTLFEVAADGTAEFWPALVDRAPVIELIGRLGGEDRLYFEGATSVPHDHTSLLDVEDALHVRLASIDIEEATPCGGML